MTRQESLCQEILNDALRDPEIVADHFRPCVEKLAAMRGKCSDPFNPFASVAYERLHSWVLEIVGE